MSRSRIQQRRVAGWRKPLGVRAVTRGTPWGNPFSVAKHGREQAVALYRQHVASMQPEERRRWLEPLRHVRTLMCWCAPDQSCHADVLIEVLDEEFALP